MWTPRTKSPNKFKVKFGSCEPGINMVYNGLEINLGDLV